VARPGEGDYAAAGPARGDPFDEDPDDRLVEHVPRYIELDDPGFGEPTPGDAGFDGPAARVSFDGPASTQNPGFGGPAARVPFGEPGTPEQGSDAGFSG
jgi:hypothetical protein